MVGIDGFAFVSGKGDFRFWGIAEVGSYSDLAQSLARKLNVGARLRVVDHLTFFI